MARLLVLFFASGCAALIYETVWFYLVQLVVGASSISVAVLLCAFMGGMAIGSWLLPKLTPSGTNPFKVVAALEAGIAVFGIAIPLALPYIPQIYLDARRTGAGAISLRAVGLPLRPHPTHDVDGRNAARRLQERVAQKVGRLSLHGKPRGRRHRGRSWPASTFCASTTP
jgi:hypothetical protein